MININVSIIGAETINAAINNMIGRITDLSPAFASIRDSFWGIEEEQFSSEGGFSGGWKELSPSYSAWKESVAAGMPILQLSGALMRSLTGQTGDSITQIDPMEARFGTTLPRGAKHQDGDGVPARPPISITKEHRQQWVDIIRDYIGGGS